MNLVRHGLFHRLGVSGRHALQFVCSIGRVLYTPEEGMRAKFSTFICAVRLTALARFQTSARFNAPFGALKLVLAGFVLFVFAKSAGERV